MNLLPNLPESLQILPGDGEVLYFRKIFDTATSDAYFHELIQTIEWKQHSIRIFGNMIPQPRLTAWYGNVGTSYQYSGLQLDPIPFDDLLQKIKSVVEQIANTPFNSVLLNLYRDGNDYMGWHRDNEKTLGEAPVIASVTFGEQRKFQFRKYRTHNQLQTIMLETGSVIIMRGNTQQYWEHRLPKASQATGARINLTFRNII